MFDKFFEVTVGCHGKAPKIVEITYETGMPAKSRQKYAIMKTVRNAKIVSNILSLQLGLNIPCYIYYSTNETHMHINKIIDAEMQWAQPV